MFHTDFEPPEDLLKKFRSRKDNQILGLELLAIALGLSSFRSMVEKRRVVVWSDNTGAEHGTDKGRCKE